MPFSMPAWQSRPVSYRPHPTSSKPSDGLPASPAAQTRSQHPTSDLPRHRLSSRIRSATSPQSADPGASANDSAHAMQHHRAALDGWHRYSSCYYAGELQDQLLPPGACEAGFGCPVLPLSCCPSPAAVWSSQAQSAWLNSRAPVRRRAPHSCPTAEQASLSCNICPRAHVSARVSRGDCTTLVTAPC